jgi:hypothetical protein
MSTIVLDSKNYCRIKVKKVGYNGKESDGLMVFVVHTVTTTRRGEKKRNISVSQLCMALCMALTIWDCSAHVGMEVKWFHKLRRAMVRPG